MKIEFVSGNFKLVVDGMPIVEIGNISEEVSKAQAEIVEAGLTYIIQRDVASKAYLALAGVEGKGGKRSLPKFLLDGKTKWSRDQVAFTPENATTFAQIAEKALARYGSFTISVTEYIRETVGDSKLVAEARALAKKAISGGKALGMAIYIDEQCGYEVDLATDEEQLVKGVVHLLKWQIEEAKRKAAGGLAAFQ